MAVAAGGGSTSGICSNSSRDEFPLKGQERKDRCTQERERDGEREKAAKEKRIKGTKRVFTVRERRRFLWFTARIFECFVDAPDSKDDSIHQKSTRMKDFQYN